MKRLRRKLYRSLSENQRKKVRKIHTHLLSYRYFFDLNNLGKLYRTDKAGSHGYTAHYQTHFKSLKLKKINLLEIGVGGYEDPNKGGNSLRMWKRYFPFGNIYAIDIYEKSNLQENRIKIFQGSQIDERFLSDLIADIGDPDIIIDDGSHLNRHVTATFNILFPFLKEGGIYVIEDVQTSYWPPYGGDSVNRNNPKTTMGFLKNLVDGLNHKEFILPGYVPSFYDENIISMHFYHNLIFIHKGKNNQESNKVVNNERLV